MSNSNQMFCFQCEQTAKGTGCTVAGVCGKKSDTSDLQDTLTGKLIGLANAALGAKTTEETDRLLIDSLFATVTNVSFDNDRINQLCTQVDAQKKMLVPADNTSVHDDDFDMQTLWNDNEDIRSLKSLLLFGIRGMAAYAHHAAVLGRNNSEVSSFFYEALAAIAQTVPAEKLLEMLMRLGQVNLTCMAMLDEANTGTYGTPVPTSVSTKIEKGPFIVISGHDLHDLQLLLEQTDGKGINIYTHSEMLPSHSYPELKKYTHLKGNFGTAWQNQQTEFTDIPAPILFTTNCLMPPKANYADRVFTTSVVAFPSLVHIDDRKDFTPVIRKALELGGYSEEHTITGINGGTTLTTGFGHGTVLSVADKVVDAVKTGAIKHFFLVGGCDGAKPGRNYYTDFVRQTPDDSVILTLACGKYRFNDLDLGTIGGLPRMMDMGQCNDSYSAIRVAVALAEAFECGVNELPLTMVLSWYEQKAVAILLTLFSLGIKNIYIGPSLPAFISKGVLDVLVEKFQLTPISTPENDLRNILNQ